MDGDFLPVDPFPRLDRFKEHTVELPVGDLVVSPTTRPSCAGCWPRRWSIGKGVMHLLSPLTGLRGAMMAGTAHRAPWAR